MRQILSHISSLIKLKQLWLYLFLVKAVISALFAIPFFLTFNSELSLSSMSKSILTEWDFSLFIELLEQNIGSIIPNIALFMIGGFLYALVMQFLNGGLYYLIVFGRFNNIEWKDFFAECGLRFGTHLKISAVMLIIYLILLPFSFFLINFLGGFGAYLSGYPLLLVMLAKLLLIFLILTGASLFSDSLRSASAAEPGLRLKELMNKSADFFRPRLILLFKYFIVTYLPFVVIWLLVEFLSLKLNILLAGFFGIIIEFLLFQLSSFCRTGQKLWYLILLGQEYRRHNPGRFQSEQTELKL